uniref:Retrovirus-related Pol polyprotein from transposon TNT 1-94 n=1 Tax=Cajanus cajan TaxID=3821 RepID=A0A151RLQ6_CAJCA|nr:Retrovirus-related Pol polyprotein from transposon TNT 1-94 [Cajanus cajan]KYP43438.1 Retrovirus-related Pol polyprotein from transposon TNT 1-94 [Cajanus cajan]KYP43445.1 Retrovirus-related Pol polyprotein from transposon TNT 1-94 [Cajanus cajan]
MDSSASFHASPYKDLMKNFKIENFGKVHLANVEALDIAGMRDINLRISTGTVWTLKDVRYILGLKRMLISMGMLDVQGYRVTFKDGQWKVVKGNLVVARGWKK